MKAWEMCQELADLIKKTEIPPEKAEAPEEQEDPDALLRERILSVLAEMHRNASLAEDLKRTGAVSYAELEKTEKAGSASPEAILNDSRLFYLSAAAVRVLSSEVFLLTGRMKDRKEARKYNSEAVSLVRHAGPLGDEMGRLAAEELLFRRAQ